MGEAMKRPVPIKIQQEKETYLDDILQLEFPKRKKTQFSLKEKFKLDAGPERDANNQIMHDEQGNIKTRDRLVNGFEKPTEHRPDHVSYYAFPKDDTLAVLMGMSCQEPILAVGHTGCGKTSLFEQIADRLNYAVFKVSLDGSVSRNDLLGEWVVKGKETVFQYGIIPYAFRYPGAVIILDEWDTQNEDTSFVMQRPLQQEDRKLMLLETRQLVPMHPDNILVATANTAGQGDDTGLYSQGTRVQSYAQLNRFSITIRLNYPNAEAEKQIVKGRFEEVSDPLNDDEIEILVSTVNKVRDGYTNGQISVPLSTRDLINWADKYIKYGNITKAARYAFLNRMGVEDAKVCEGLIKRVYQKEA